MIFDLRYSIYDFMYSVFIELLIYYEICFNELCSGLTVLNSLTARDVGYSIFDI